jgi:hypothetical protein
MLTSAPVLTSQIFTRLSADPLTMLFPSADNATESTFAECPFTEHSGLIAENTSSGVQMHSPVQM